MLSTSTSTPPPTTSGIQTLPDRNDIDGWTAYLEKKKGVESTKVLMELYTAATSRLSVDKFRTDPRLLHIWLAFLELCGENDTYEEMRDKYKFLKSRMGGHSARFYVQWANFENGYGHKEKAIGILKTGISVRAQPATDIESSLRKLQGNNQTTVPLVKEAKVDLQPEPKTLPEVRTLSVVDQSNNQNQQPAQQLRPQTVALIQSVTKPKSAQEKAIFNETSGNQNYVNVQTPICANDLASLKKISAFFNSKRKEVDNTPAELENGVVAAESPKKLKNLSLERSTDMEVEEISTQAVSNIRRTTSPVSQIADKSSPTPESSKENKKQLDLPSSGTVEVPSKVELQAQSVPSKIQQLPLQNIGKDKPSQIPFKVSTKIARTPPRTSPRPLPPPASLRLAVSLPLPPMVEQFVAQTKPNGVLTSQTCSSTSSQTLAPSMASPLTRTPPSSTPPTKYIPTGHKDDPPEITRSSSTTHSKTASSGGDSAVYDVERTVDSIPQSSVTSGSSQQSVPVRQLRVNQQPPPLGFQSVGRDSNNSTPVENEKPNFDLAGQSLLGEEAREDLATINKSLLITVNQVTYRKIELIGRGASSKVYKVISESGQIYALKKVKLDWSDPTAVEGYLNEIQLLKKLEGHKNIIKLVDSELVKDKKHLFMILEFGEIDLAHLMTKDGGKVGDLNFVRMYWCQMLRAVQCIHDEHIIHSDLKPANFILVEGSLKLIDFGIAKSIPNDTTNIHRDYQTGTINYMAPEAIMATETNCPKGNIKLGRASDVWSLGCILYQLVYGRPPFASLPIVQKLHAIVDPKYTITFPDIEDMSLVEVMKSCLNRDPKKRMGIPELLVHKSLHPGKSEPNSGTPGVFLTLEELAGVIREARGCNIDAGVLSQQFYEMFSRE